MPINRLEIVRYTIEFLETHTLLCVTVNEQVWYLLRVISEKQECI